MYVFCTKTDTGRYLLLWCTGLHKLLSASQKNSLSYSNVNQSRLAIPEINSRTNRHTNCIKLFFCSKNCISFHVHLVKS